MRDHPESCTAADFARGACARYADPRMRRLLPIAVILAGLAAPAALLAHPGPLDAYGCHECESQHCAEWQLDYLEYHCHNDGAGKNDDYLPTEAQPLSLRKAAPSQPVSHRAAKPLTRRAREIVYGSSSSRSMRFMRAAAAYGQLLSSSSSSARSARSASSSTSRYRTPEAAAFATLAKRYREAGAALEGIAADHAEPARTQLRAALDLYYQWLGDFDRYATLIARRNLTDAETANLKEVLQGLQKTLRTFQDIVGKAR